MQKDIERNVFEVVAWSFNVALANCFPSSDHLGLPWPKGSQRERWAGSPLSGAGFVPVCAGIVGEWKWIAETFHHEQGFNHIE
eukprot:10595974-Alexandrium_andersonii.AAC.1